MKENTIITQMSVKLLIKLTIDVVNIIIPHNPNIFDAYYFC